MVLIKKIALGSLLLLMGVASLTTSLLIQSPQKANAQLCYVTVEAGQEEQCRDGETDGLQAGKCYAWSGGDRQGNGRGYNETPCPVPATFTAGKDPVCTQNGQKVDCPNNASTGKCYNVTSSRGGTQLSERPCTVADHPDYKPGNTITDTVDTSKPPVCYDGTTVVDCPSSVTSNPANAGLCFRKPERDNLTWGRISCSTAQQEVVDEINNQGDITEGSETCEDQGGLGWLACPIINMLDGVLNFVDTQIQALLAVNEDMYKDNEQLYTAWTRFRNLAYILLIPTMLIMVIGTALGFEFFSAYTVKKALPRMVVATIFITLSWYICTFLINVTNVVGAGVLGLITQPFNVDADVSLQDLFAADLGDAATSLALAGGIFAYLALSSVTIGVVISYAFVVTLAIGAAFLVLSLRQMLIIALILAAPMAILSWIFPNNDKPWKTWWSLFSKLLIMFPLIMGLIGIGRVFATLINIAPGNTGFFGDVLNPLLKIAFYTLPYFLIPLTFKFAGGIFANLAGMINDRERGVFDRQRKKREETRQATKHRADNNLRFNPNGRLRRLNGLASWAANPNANARVALGLTSGKSIMSNVAQSKFEQTQKLSEVLSKIGMNDVALRALSTGYTEGYDADGNKVTVAAWNGTRKDMDRVVREMGSLRNKEGAIDENARLAAKQLQDNSGFLFNSYLNEDYGKGSVMGAAGLSLASQGFITPNDIAYIGNKMDEKMTGTGSMFKTTAELLGSRGGALTKPGYTVQLNDDGSFRAGDFATRVNQATRIGTQDWGGAKGGQIDDNFGAAITGILSGQTIMTTNSRGEVEERLRVVNPDNPNDVAFIDPNMRREVEETLAQTYASYTAPDVRNRIRKQLVNAEVASGRTRAEAEASVNTKLSRYSRAANPDEILRGGPPEPPPGTPGA